MPQAIVVAQNPYLPLWEHLPDGEPRVFEDPDRLGYYRLYIIGSHDVRFDSYCGPDIRIWSAPVEDLTDWRDHGPVFTYQDPNTDLWDVMYAPDLVEVNRRDGTRSYYLFPHSRGPGREAMVARSDRPDGPFTPINVTEDGRVHSGSIIGFDPHVYIEQITDPNDPDYEIGFRAFAYWGFMRAYAAELDQNTMYSLRPGTEIIDFFIPSSSSYGVVRDPSGTVYPHVFPDEDLTSFNYFEAFSIRKVGNKYVLVFSGYSGPDYGISSTNSTLRYAFGDTPLGPWRSGGVLIDSRAIVPNRDGTALRTTGTGHNTHGGIQQIDDQWYVFYHRASRGFGYARQAMVAPIIIDWDELSVAEGGRVTIRAYDPFAEDGIWTARASNGDEYTGAQVTSEGFHIFGLDPFNYYSAGIASFFSHPETLQNSWNIWDNHMPITNVSTGHIIGFQHFGFGGLSEDTRGLRAFEGSTLGGNTEINVYLTPRTNQAFTVNVWLDGPWDTEAWGGTQIGQIHVPADSPNEVTRFTTDVAGYVEHLSGKNGIFLVAEGGSGSLFDLIGLGFSDDERQIERPIPPIVSIYVDGEVLELPTYPLRSTSANGIVGYDIFEVNVTREPDAGTIPVVTATASVSDVAIEIDQIDDVYGTAVVKFDYNGVVKTYRVNFMQFSPWSEPVRHLIADRNPVFEGPARIAWGDTIGFMDAGNPPGAVIFTVNVPETGRYRMFIYHTTPWGASSHYITINDDASILFDYPERDWSLTEFTNDFILQEGDNTIRFEFNSGITELRWVELERYVGYPNEDEAIEDEILDLAGDVEIDDTYELGYEEERERTLAGFLVLIGFLTFIIGSTVYLNWGRRGKAKNENV